ncbi:hypothetical protein CLIB1423_27S00166 [[Candida] railenensis]|uniref:Flavin reductase like domain-containing protein n=1 Tax=[Candida] railenensis TaxID=45579 RepID=A0A9P0QUW9_9ASCO|nr:hypothetical protein CLIB1423_27S00166 [[Candida] railenensis]
MISSLRKYSTSTLNDVFKSSMSRISCQAMILTAGQAKVQAGSSHTTSLHGMTLSSTCSLSVYPTPLLQFNLHLPSYTSQTLHDSKHLALHLLPPNHNTANLARLFANGIKAPPAKDDGDIFHEKTTPFDTLEHGKDWKFHTVAVDDLKFDIPILTAAEEVFICKKRSVFEIDSHEIWVVEVLEILSTPNDEPTGGLLYFNRNFHKIGGTLRLD